MDDWTYPTGSYEFYYLSIPKFLLIYVSKKALVVFVHWIPNFSQSCSQNNFRSQIMLHSSPARAKYVTCFGDALLCAIPYYTGPHYIKRIWYFDRDSNTIPHRCSESTPLNVYTCKTEPQPFMYTPRFACKFRYFLVMNLVLGRFKKVYELSIPRSVYISPKCSI